MPLPLSGEGSPGLRLCPTAAPRRRCTALRLQNSGHRGRARRGGGRNRFARLPWSFRTGREGQRCPHSPRAALSTCCMPGTRGPSDAGLTASPAEPQHFTSHVFLLFSWRDAPLSPRPLAHARQHARRPPHIVQLALEAGLGRGLTPLRDGGRGDLGR